MLSTVFGLALFTIRTTLRARGSLLHHVGLLTVLAVLALVLLGLRDGAVAAQRAKIQSNAAATTVTAWAAGRRGVPFSRGLEQEWEATHSVQVIPEIEAVVDLEREAGGPLVAGVTLHCTKFGDPSLAARGLDRLRPGDSGVVLGHVTARALGIAAGAREPVVTLTVRRTDREGQTQSHTVRVSVRAVADFGDGHTGFAERTFLDRIEDYRQGRAVPAFGWPSADRPAAPAYPAYLSFSREALSDFDVTKLRARGLTVTRLDPANPAHAERCRLGGWLGNPVEFIYQITTGTDDLAAPPELTLRPEEVEDITDVDDVVVPWSSPLSATRAGLPVRLVGTTPRLRWLAGSTSTDRPPEAEEVSLVDLGSGQTVPITVLTRRRDDRRDTAVAWVQHLRHAWQHWRDRALGRRVEGDAPVGPDSLTAASPTGPAVVFTSPATLAQAHALLRGEVVFDADRRVLVPTPRENVYYRARVIAPNLDAVMGVDEWLRSAGYATQSQRQQVEELREYGRTLDQIVTLVGGTVFGVLLWVMLAALSHDVSTRRRALGTLMLLGVSRAGVVGTVVFRGLIYGVLASALTVPVSQQIARFLTESGTRCQLEWPQLAGVVIAVLTVCLLGTTVAAIRAAGLTPGDALRGG